MSDAPAPSAPTEAPPSPPSPPAARQERHLLRWVVIGGIALGLAIVLFLIGAAFIPRWWAQRLGDQVGGSVTGIGVGLFYGTVFTFLPLVALWLGFRKRRPWLAWLAWLAAAALLAMPNLLTLGIVIGQGDAAHAGERILDVEAPYVRGATLVGAIIAAAIFLVMQYFLITRRRTKALQRELREQTRPREAPPADPEPPSAA